MSQYPSQKECVSTNLNFNQCLEPFKGRFTILVLGFFRRYSSNIPDNDGITSRPFFEELNYCSWMKLATQHSYINHTRTVTTGAASNNTTLMAAASDTIHVLQLGTEITIIQVPCMATGIQLSLKWKDESIPKK